MNAEAFLAELQRAVPADVTVRRMKNYAGALCWVFFKNLGGRLAYASIPGADRDEWGEPEVAAVTEEAEYALGRLARDVVAKTRAT